MSTENYGDPGSWVTVDQAVQRFNTSRTTVYTLINSGQVERVRLPGRQVRVRLRVADLEEALGAVHG